MSSPVNRTALREEENRSLPASQQVSASPVTGPTPYSRAASTFAPVRCRAVWVSCLRSGPSWASAAASMSKAVATCSCPAADRCAAAAARSASRPGSVRNAPSPSGGAPWWKNTAQLRLGGVRAAQVVVGLQQRAVLQDVLRRDPAFGQPALGQQRPKVPGVGLVGLGPPFAAPQRGGVGRLAQMRGDPGRGQFPGDIPPARASLHRERDIPAAGEPGQPGPHVRPVGRGDLAPLDLPGHGIQIVEGDLLSVNVQPAYDGHRDLLTLPGRPRRPHANGLRINRDAPELRRSRRANSNRASSHADGQAADACHLIGRQAALRRGVAGHSG